MKTFSKKLFAAGVAATLLTPAFLSGQTASVGQMRTDSRGLRVATEKGELRIIPLSSEIFYVTTVPEGTRPGLKESPAAVLKPESMPDSVFITADTRYIIVSSPTTKVFVDRATGKVSFYDNKGRLLLSEAEGIDNRGGNTRATFVRPEGDTFYGAGERGHSLALNGDSLVMFNRQNYGYGEGDKRISQMGITMPYIVSDRGYGLLFDDHNEALLTLGDTITYTSGQPARLPGYFFINGSGSLKGATKEFTRLTGRQGLPPFWSLGYITSKYGYHTQDEALGVIDSLKTRGYPVDGIVFDLYWYGKETDMGRLEWSKEQFPDHKKMLDSLRRQGVKTVLIHQPYINKIGAIDNYNVLTDAGLLTHNADGTPADVTTWVGEAGMFDVSNPYTVNWMKNRLAEITEEGVEGWWGDLGEPEVHPLNITHANGMTASQYHNQYGNDWSRLVYEMMNAEDPERRVMTLMRGGTTGLQRYNVFPWSTDVSRSWEGLQPQIKIMLNSGLSGLGYMSSDIGGFAVDPANPTDEELYVRWLQMGAFTPTLRTHAQLKPEPYHYPQSENILKRYIDMRYEWLPYNYTLAYENAAAGLPLVRTLDFDNPSAAGLYANVEDEYLWGSEVLVAPVIKKGERSRKVTFPEGATWIDWWNPTVSYPGGTTRTVKAPLDKLPLFVRAGSFIPQYTHKIENTEQYNPQWLTVRYYPSAEKTEYVLYDDDRKSPVALRDGEYQLTTFTGSRTDGVTQINVSTNGTAYRGMPDFRDLTLVIENVTRKPHSVTTNTDFPMPETGSLKGIRQSGWHYDSKAHTVTVRLPWTYDDLEVIVR